MPVGEAIFFLPVTAPEMTGNYKGMWVAERFEWFGDIRSRHGENLQIDGGLKEFFTEAGFSAQIICPNGQNLRVRVPVASVREDSARQRREPSEMSW